MAEPGQTERASPKETVKLHQEIQFFDETSVPYPKQNSPPEIPHLGLKTDIKLQLTDSLVLPFNLVATPVAPRNRRKTEAFTPEDSSLGYELTNEDFDYKARKAKKAREDHILIPEGNFQLLLEARSEGRDLHKLGLSEERSVMFYNLNENLRELTNRLRLHVMFPETGMAYQSRPDEMGLENGEICFNRFFPGDLQELASSNNPSTALLEGLHNGLFLALSSNRNHLETMRGYFYLEGEEQPIPEEPIPPTSPTEYIPPLGVKRKS